MNTITECFRDYKAGEEYPYLDIKFMNGDWMVLWYDGEERWALKNNNLHRDNCPAEICNLPDVTTWWRHGKRV